MSLSCYRKNELYCFVPPASFQVDAEDATLHMLSRSGEIHLIIMES